MGKAHLIEYPAIHGLVLNRLRNMIGMDNLIVLKSGWSESLLLYQHFLISLKMTGSDHLMKGYVPDTWRYRIGNFRIFYTSDQEEGIIYILTIDHRKDAYQ